jgi:exosortase D (VPLPA-CTERM-specific)
MNDHSTTLDASTSRVASGSRQPGWWWLVLLSIGMVAFFWDGLVSLLQAWARPEYSYGPLVPVITAYMTLRELHRHPLTPNADSRLPGLLVIAAGLLVGLFGNLSKIPDIITYGFILAIGGVILVMAGWRQGLRFWPGWLHLIFMLPLPNMIYWPLSIQLQFISSRLGVDMIYLLDIPVYLDGNIIDLGVYKLQVAEACNGLRYLFPLMSFGWLFAVLYTGPNWHRVVLFLSTIPITILMNSFRIGVIGVLVNRYGIGHAEGFTHFFEGWIIFIACMLVLFAEAWLLQRLTFAPKPLSRVIDVDVDCIMGPLRELGRKPTHRGLVAATVLLLVAGAAWQLAPSRAEVTVERRSLGTFPMQLDAWQGKRNLLDPTIERVLGANDYLIADYSRPDGTTPVNLFVTFYKSQTAGEGIHSPEVCIPGSGWEVSRWAKTPLSVSNGSKTVTFDANRAIIQKGLERQLVYYWFEQRGRKVTNDFVAKFYTLWDSISKSRTDGGLVRVVTPIAQSEPDSAADARLKAFLQDALPMLDDYVPGAWPQGEK